MPERQDERIATWRLRWDNRQNWIRDIISCLRGDPPQKAVRRILRLPWYTLDHGFQFLSFSPEQTNLILDLRGIPLQNTDLAGMTIPFALLEGADFYKANLENADLSYIRGIGASFHQARMDGVKLTAARLDGCDLSMALLNRADLRRARLDGADMGWSELNEANLRSANLNGTNLERAKLQTADFTEAKLDRANLSMADAREANFDSVSLREAKLIAANLEKANFAYADLEGADLSLAYLQDSYFTSASLKRANLTRTHLENTDLYEADLNDANLFAAHLDGAALKRASLRKANLSAAVLRQAYLKHADLSGANLQEAYLLESNIEDADLREADLTDCHFRSAKLSAITNDGTKFGQSDNGMKKSPYPKRFSDWLFLPYSRLTKVERDNVNPTDARAQSHQVRMLFRDNGLFSKAAVYSEQENYWKTRQYRIEEKWRRYLGRLIFFERFMGYGERPFRVVLTGLMMIVAFGFFFLASGIVMDGRIINYSSIGGIPALYQVLHDLWLSILFSIQCFTTLGLLVIRPANELSLTLASIEGLLGFFIIALWIVVFVRKAIRD